MAHPTAAAIDAAILKAATARKNFQTALGNPPGISNPALVALGSLDAAAADLALTLAACKPPVVTPPVDPPPDIDPGPPITSGFGCRVPLASLTDWTAKLVTGSGKPAAIPAYGSGGTMEKFRFHPPPTDPYVGPNGWASFYPPKPVLVRDIVVGPGFKTWGSNAKGVASEVVEFITVENDLAATYTAEHGCYRGIQGGGTGIVRRGCLYKNQFGAGIQITHRDQWVHGGPKPGAVPMKECTDLATCFSPGGPILFENNRFERCSAKFEAATISIQAGQQWDSGAKMPPASHDAIIRNNQVDNATTVIPADWTYNTLLLVAGKKNVTITGNEFRRASKGRQKAGTTLRPMLQLGDPYTGGTTWGTAYAPCVEVGGLLKVDGNKFWSDEPFVVHIWNETGAKLDWKGNTMLPGSAAGTVMLNGTALGPVTGTFAQ